MKKSRDIRLTLVPVLAASAIAAGCGSRQEPQGWQACVDQNGVVANDQRCADEQRGVHPSGYVPMYHWYYYRPYGGAYTTVPGIGQAVPPGGEHSMTPFSGVSRSGPVTGSVTRGGFGSTAHGSAGE